jgi:ABC-type transporter Mla MlaB component
MTEPRGAIVVVVPDVLSPAAVTELCERVRAFVESRATLPVVCDVSAITAPDATSLDALARVQLIARRAGIPVGLRNPPAVLLDLLEIAGLRGLIEVPAGATGGASATGRSVVEGDR